MLKTSAATGSAICFAAIPATTAAAAVRMPRRLSVPLAVSPDVFSARSRVSIARPLSENMNTDGIHPAPLRYRGLGDGMCHTVSVRPRWGNHHARSALLQALLPARIDAKIYAPLSDGSALAGAASLAGSGWLIFGRSNFANRSPLMSARLATTR